MQKLSRLIAADFLKLRKTPFFMLHLAVPAAGLLIFLGYLGINKHTPAEYLTANFYQALTLIYPLVAAWVCSLVTEQENEAANSFFLLHQPCRRKALLSKLLFLTLSGLAACMVFMLGYHALAPLMRQGFVPSLLSELRMALTVWGCALFQYFFHTWLGLRFGRNTSFAAASVQVLLSALLITGLGNGIWFLFPSAWGIRLVALLARYQASGDAAIFGAVRLGVLAAALATLFMLTALFLWFSRWEGRKSEA